MDALSRGEKAHHQLLFNVLIQCLHNDTVRLTYGYLVRDEYDEVEAADSRNAPNYNHWIYVSD
jgi:hypothetical protein